MTRKRENLLGGKLPESSRSGIKKKLNPTQKKKKKIRSELQTPDTAFRGGGQRKGVTSWGELIQKIKKNSYLEAG